MESEYHITQLLNLRAKCILDGRFAGLFEEFVCFVSLKRCVSVLKVKLLT